MDELDTLGTRGPILGGRNPNRLILLGIVAIVVAAIAFGSFFTIDQGYRGVVLRLGAFARVADAGLGFKLPFIDRVVRIRVQTNSKIYDRMEAYSRDQQLAELRLSVTYRIVPEMVNEVYAQFGSEDGLVSRLIDRRVNELAKTVFGRFNAVEAIQMRGSLNQQVSDSIIAVIDQNVVVIESVQIEDIAFSSAYEQSVEARMMAEVEVQRRTQELEQQRIQAQIVVTQAQGAADARVAEAKAQAEATILAGDAEASAIRVKGEALRDNPELIALITAENWNGVLPTTMLPGGTIPFIDLGQ
ncbi:MAG TPA: SPFH domain-containing protein [Trueperaceae bacterium]|nr:SPFH domain-containing protein [Trueperaceae bacterium]